MSVAYLPAFTYQKAARPRFAVDNRFVKELIKISFYLAAEKVICIHFKMCLELQVAFSFKTITTLVSNIC